MIDKRAYIGKNVNLGEHVVIEEGVILGDGVTIGHHSVIKKDTIVGDHVTVGNMTSLGKYPSGNAKMTRNSALDTDPLVIGNNVHIGDNCVLYRGSILHEDIFIGDMASIREQVEIKKNSVIGRNVMVENRTTIGENVTIQTSSYITAYMEIQDEVFIGPCCSTSNDKYMRSGGVGLKGPVIKYGAKIGSNASLLPGIIIGNRAIVGAGTVVVHDVPDHSKVIGFAGIEKDND